MAVSDCSAMLLLTHLFASAASSVNRQGCRGLTTDTCDCQLLHGRLWGIDSPQDSIWAYMLVLLHWWHVCGLASWIRKTGWLP